MFPFVRRELLLTVFINGLLEFTQPKKKFKKYFVVSQVKWAAVVERDQKASFSIATTTVGGALLLSLGCSTLPLIYT